MSKVVEIEPYGMDTKEASKFIGCSAITEVTKTNEKNKIHNTFHKNDFNVKKEATFERCIDFMARMIEKYSHEME